MRAIVACGTLLTLSMAHASQGSSQVVVDGGERMGDVVRKSGHDVSLLRAIESVVPPSYSVMVPNAGPWADVLVSWRSGSVVRALGDILSVDPSLEARVNTSLRIVSVAQNPRFVRALHDARSVGAVHVLEAGQTIEGASADAPVAAGSALKVELASIALPGAAEQLTISQPPAKPPSGAAAVRVASESAHIALPGTEPVRVAKSSQLMARPSTAPRSKELPAEAHMSADAVAIPAVASPVSQPMSQPDPAAVPPLMQSSAQTEWVLRMSDGSVRRSVARWASEAGWQFIWDVPTDFVIDATATIHGSFSDALRQVSEAMSSSQVPIQMILYTRNRVLRVVAKGASS
ncbi:TcpQ domain-containing protein [Burkholderia sp. Ac-20384]|uniref:toxin co-regulated pilus biosynthesis Q family protein n=1 Tax=Burkholderia sp. Ac-20384 TaxID=2703902 RepID=UPI003217186E